MRQVIVIGAGASGMMAAVTAARAGCKVIILEHTARSGRKIEITGNGKCNFTNTRQELSCYHTQKPAYVKQILQQFTVEQTLEFFEDLGIVPKCKNGYYYPYSGQAQAVSQALRREAERLRVRFACNMRIINIKKEHMFCIETESISLPEKQKKNIRRKSKEHSSEQSHSRYTYTADAVILATGSKAASFTGSDGSGYVLAEKLGHTIRNPLPALVQLQCTERETALLAGLRAEGSVTLYIDGKPFEKEFGEIQFINNGLSGIPIFQISSHGARALAEGKQVAVRVNFLSGTGWKSIPEQLEMRKRKLKHTAVSQFLCGLLHERAIKALCKKMDIKGNQPVETLENSQWNQLTELLQAWEFPITKTGSYDQAQVCSGGVVFDQLEEGTLESRLLPGLYFAGEILDVDGICGGYNLQWAWTSGYVAGTKAAEG